MLYYSPDPRLQPRQTKSWYIKISSFCFWLNLFQDQKQELNYTGSDLVMIYVQKEIQGTNLHHPTIINQDGVWGCNITLHYWRIVSLQIKVYEDK